MLGQQGHWLRLISSQTGSQPRLPPAAASLGLGALVPLCRSSSSSATGGEGSSRRRARQPRGRSKGASDQVQLNAAPEPLPAPDIASNAAALAPPLDAANRAAADARTAPAAQSLSELVPEPSGPRLEFPDAPFKLRPYQVDAIRSIIHSWKSGNNAQMVMLPTGCGKTVVFSALSRYMSEHYVAPAPASDTAAPITDANSSPTPPAPYADGGSAQWRGSPTVAAAATGDGAVSEAAQATASEADGGGSSSRDDSSCTHVESTSSAASDGDEDLLVGAVSRFQQLRQAVTDSSGSTGASSTPPSQQRPQLGSSESSSGQSRSRAGRQAAAGKNSRHSRSSSPSTPALSTSSSSPASSSREDESGGGNIRRQPPKQQQQQQPPPQQQQQHLQQLQQQAEMAAPAGYMRVLVLAHRHELLRQAEEKFRLMWGSQDLSVSWVKGKRKEFDGQVVVASVATAVNCIPALRDCGFSLVIIDEAHHAVANTYKTILEGLGLIEEVAAPPTDTQSADTDASPGSSVSSSLSSVDEAADESLYTSDSLWSAAGKRVSGSSGDPEEAAGSQPPRVITRVIPNPHQLLLGFTATPYRRMKRESEDLYAILRPTYTASISTMIRDNYLTEVSSQKIMTETDLQGIAVSSKGDFVLGQLSPLVNSRSRNKLVLASYLEQCTEPDPLGEAARTPEQQRQHEIISRERARLVTVALQKSDRRKQAKAEEKRRAATAAAAASAADTSDSSGEEPEGDEEEEEEEEEEEAEMFPLPPGVTPEQLTGGLTMAGRRAVRRTIAFAVDIRHAEAMNVVFNAAGVHASAIHSMMPLDTMKQELARFRAGELDVLFNVEVLTEGFDEPAIDAILMARPTRSAGLYTQMLGRGLRIMPGKKDCLVLDFTDKYHQAGAVVDVRVLLDDIFGAKSDGPQEQPDRGPARIDEDAEGGLVDLLAKGIDPQDLAWRSIGPHCMTSIFSYGNVWLVNAAGMGPTQRVSLGLVAPNSRPVLQGERQQQDQAGGGGADAEDSDDEEDVLEDRYVILHQDRGDRDPDPCNWRVAYTPQNHTWRGFSKEDAYGTALTYIDTFVSTQKAKYVAQYVRAKRSGQGTPKAAYPHLDSFKQDAPWRGAAASDKQLAVLTRLGIAAGGPITKGQASDLISAHKCSLAEPAQRARLQDFLGNDLPVPLLKAHADELLAAAATADSSSSS